MECQIDALIFQIHQMAESGNVEGDLGVSSLYGIGMRCREFQRKFNECKSVCLTRREEIHLELLRWVDCDASEKDEIEDNEVYSDDEIS